MPTIDDAPSTILTGMYPKVLALNNGHTTELSRLDVRRLGELVDQAFYARQIRNVEAFLIALDERAGYASPNYSWFRARYPRFVYVDRIAVSAAARGRGHARRLHADLVARALAGGHDKVVCEVNFDPPNPASHALHASLGFTEVGRATLLGGVKTVRYLVLHLH